MKPEVLGPIRSVFSTASGEMREDAVQNRTISAENIYQEANLPNRSRINEILDRLVLPGSGIMHMENVERLAGLVTSGQSCLILMEHYSNFDIPCLYYLLERAGQRAVADAIVSIAGMKLTEESAFVNAFAEAYTRVVIYPSRSLQQHEDSAERDEEVLRSRQINMAATRHMIRLKHEGRIILLFPSGTRYRPGQPDTKRGVKEVDSYLKLFDHAVLIGSAGNVLKLNPNGDMSMDLAARDVVTLNVTAPFVCDELRDEARAETPEGVDPKQHVADVVMKRLEGVHAEAVAAREAILQRMDG